MFGMGGNKMDILFHFYIWYNGMEKKINYYDTFIMKIIKYLSKKNKNFVRLQKYLTFVDC